jgi:hypothetical protein
MSNVGGGATEEMILAPETEVENVLELGSQFSLPSSSLKDSSPQLLQASTSRPRDPIDDIVSLITVCCTILWCSTISFIFGSNELSKPVVVTDETRIPFAPDSAFPTHSSHSRTTKQRTDEKNKHQTNHSQQTTKPAYL